MAPPGSAPVVGARAGLGWQSEGGLTYTGRSIRGDVRRSFDLSDAWSLSLGVGGSGAVYDRGTAGPLPGVDLDSLHGWGAEVPLLVGYSSEGDLYSWWAGPRVGWEHVDVSVAPSAAGAPQVPVAATATRAWGSGVAGVAVELPARPHVAMARPRRELRRERLRLGSVGGTHAQIAGVTYAPLERSSGGDSEGAVRRRGRRPLRRDCDNRTWPCLRVAAHAQECADVCASAPLDHGGRASHAARVPKPMY